MNKIRFAVVGLGRMGRGQIREILKNVPARYELASDITEILPAQTAPFDPFGQTIDFTASQFSKEKVVYKGKENSLSATVQFCRYEDVVIALAR